MELEASELLGPWDTRASCYQPPPTLPNAEYLLKDDARLWKPSLPRPVLHFTNNSNRNVTLNPRYTSSLFIQSKMPAPMEPTQQAPMAADNGAIVSQQPVSFFFMISYILYRVPKLTNKGC